MMWCVMIHVICMVRMYYDTLSNCSLRNRNLLHYIAYVLAQGVAVPHRDHTDYHTTSYDATRLPTCVTVTTTMPITSTVTNNPSVMSTTTHSNRVVDNASLITAATPVTSPTATNRTSSTGSSVTSPTGTTATATKTSGGQQFNVPSHTTAKNSSTYVCLCCTDILYVECFYVH